MAMVTLAALVIVTHDADTIDDVSQPVLISMDTTLDRFRYALQDHLDESVLGNRGTPVDDLFGLHVGDYNNIRDL
jgi:hypothetical protein